MAMQIEVGQITEGKITGITKFGAFVDLGEGKSGMVHISEVSSGFVENINDFFKVGDTVKVKVLEINDNGKISLSIKKAAEGDKPKTARHNFKKTPPKPDPGVVWTPQKSESASFEEMLSKFKKSSDDKFSDLKKKNYEVRRPRSGSMN